MALPSDPNILVSMLNMKLRDGDYDSLNDLCLSLGVDESELEQRMKDAGYGYDEAVRQFKAI